MAGSGSRRIQVTVEEGVSTLIFGAAKILIGADGKKVTVYGDDGVEVKPADAREVMGTHFSVSADFKTVVLNGVAIGQAADGHLVICAPGIVITKPVPANDAVFGKGVIVEDLVPAALKPGDRMQDGTVYAGISPETGKAMYTTPADAPLTYTFNEARDYAAKLDAYGHRDWRVPTKGELNVLFNSRAAIGGFNEIGLYPAGWYWSSSESLLRDASSQRFSDGHQMYCNKRDDSSLRCVRG
jgi:hypothetical protein